MSNTENDEMIVELTPLEKVESLYQELIKWYGEADKKELRSAAKLLIVALDKFAMHGGNQWDSLVMEYVDILRNDPEKFQKIMESNRGELKGKKPTDSLH
jgi:hypothetical protein